MINPYLDSNIQSECPPTVVILRESRRKARTHHICDCCGTGIQRGELHSYFVYLDEDRKLCTSRIHLFCPTN